MLQYRVSASATQILLFPVMSFSFVCVLTLEYKRLKRSLCGEGAAPADPAHQETRPRARRPPPHKPYLLVNFAFKKNCILKVINSNSLLSFEYKTHKLLLSFVAP